MKGKLAAGVLAAALALASVLAPAGQGTAPWEPAAERVPLAQAPMAFRDVSEGDWFYTAVKSGYEGGLVSGMGDGSYFDPHGVLTRSMVITLIWRMAGEPQPMGGAFADVAENAWYGKAISWGDERGVVTGAGDGTFRPTDPITREQLATVLYRYEMKVKGNRLEVDRADLNGFPDGGSVANWAKDGMSWCVQVGLIRGKDGGRLDPKGGATRAEVVSLLVNYMTRFGA